MFGTDRRFFRSHRCIGVIIGVAMLAACDIRDREVITCSTTGAELPMIDVVELSPNAGVARLMSGKRPREGSLTTTESAYEMLFEASADGHRLHLKLDRATGTGERILGEYTVVAGENRHPLFWTMQCEPHDVSARS